MVKAKKSLGQNWLKSESAIKEIVKTADLSHFAKASRDENNSVVLEIGPGRGVLTKALLETGAQVLAIEKDDRLIEELGEKFKEAIKENKLILVHDDILNLNFSDLLSSLYPNPKILIPTYKLVANIPYYITGQVIRKFLSEEKNQPSRMVLMVQKEVAKRIVASDSKESLLSISVKVYGTPKYIKTVPAGAFEPKPKVDSAILLIENISRNFFDKIEEKNFFALLKKGFGQKRKLLKGNLRPRPAEVASREALAKWDKKIEEVFKTCNLPVKARAENLTLENWQCLVEKV